MRRHFLTGLTLLLPLVVTLTILSWIINFITRPFLGILPAKLLVLAALFGLTLLIGFLAKTALVRTWVKLTDRLFDQIPFVNSIYTASKEVVHTLLDEQRESFTEVVLVPFPHARAFAIGLITHRSLPEGSDPDLAPLTSVFLPACPNPAMGFLTLHPQKNLIPLDVSVEEALRLVISCGVLGTPLLKKVASDLE